MTTRVLLQLDGSVGVCISQATFVATDSGSKHLQQSTALCPHHEKPFITRSQKPNTCSPSKVDCGLLAASCTLCYLLRLVVGQACGVHICRSSHLLCTDCKLVSCIASLLPSLPLGSVARCPTHALVENKQEPQPLRKCKMNGWQGALTCDRHRAVRIHKSQRAPTRWWRRAQGEHRMPQGSLCMPDISTELRGRSEPTVQLQFC